MSTHSCVCQQCIQSVGIPYFCELPTCNTMAACVIVHSLDLMEAYHSVRVSSPTVQWPSVAVSFQPVSGVIKKDYTDTECSSSVGASVETLTYESIDLLWRYWSSQWAPHTSPTPTHLYSLELLPSPKPSAWTNTHEQLLLPQRLKNQCQQELSCRLVLSNPPKVIVGDITNSEKI